MSSLPVPALTTQVSIFLALIQHISNRLNLLGRLISKNLLQCQELSVGQNFCNTEKKLSYAWSKPLKAGCRILIVCLL